MPLGFGTQQGLRQGSTVRKRPITIPIVCWGNSITFGTPNPADVSPPGQLATALGQSITNAGQPGATSFTLDPLPAPDGHQGIALLMIGSNDIAAGTPAANIAAQITSIANTARAQGYRVGLLCVTLRLLDGPATLNYQALIALLVAMGAEDNATDPRIGGNADVFNEVIYATADTTHFQIYGSSYILQYEDRALQLMWQGPLDAAPVSISAPPTPATGSTTGGDTVTIPGAGFVAGAIVHFGPGLATNVVVDNDGQITCDTPVGTAGAATTISVTNADGGIATLFGAFTYETPAFSRTSPVQPLKIWIDANILVIETTQGNPNCIAEANDQSGNGLGLEQTNEVAALRPKAATNPTNGKTCIHFDGTSYMTGPSLVAALEATGGHWFFVLESLATGGVAQGFEKIGSIGGGAGTDYFPFSNNDTFSSIGSTTRPSLGALGSPGFVYGNPFLKGGVFVMEVVSVAGRRRVRCTNMAAATAILYDNAVNTPGYDPTGWLLGASAGAANSVPAGSDVGLWRVHEVLAYAGELSDPDAAGIVGLEIADWS